MFVDQNGNPLPSGTVLRVPALYDHEGIVGYDAAGQQVMLHNSKRRGRAALTGPDEFNEGHPIVVVRGPQNPQQANRVVQKAWEDVQRQRPWSWFDNCQDFVSRAYDDQSGSMTRNFVVGGLIVAGLLFSVSGNRG